MSRLSDIQKQIKNKYGHEPVENESCKNCGTVFSGHYCPECGQSEKEVNRPFSIVFYDFLGNIFAFDTRFWKTFVNLIFRPGFLTKEFFDGRRVRYAPPMRFFIFASFVLFLLLQIFTNRGLNSVMYGSDRNSLVIDSVSQKVLDTVITETGIEIKQQLTENFPGEDSLKLEGLNLNIDLADFRNARDFKDALNVIAARLEKQLESETDPEKRAKLIRYINLTRSPQHAVNRILKYISWAFFLLLPVFALLLKLFYIRRKHQYYIRHLIFSIHFHSFVFLVFIVITLLYGLIDSSIGTVVLILLCTIPVYFIIALKKFYGQGIGKILLKFIGISFAYNIIFWMALSLAFINALNII